MVDIALVERLGEHLLAVQPVLRVGTAQLLAACVDDHLMTRFRVYHLDQSHIGQRLCSLVVHLDGHHVVLAVADGQRLQEVFPLIEVAQQEGCAAALDGTRQKLHSHTDVRAAAVRLEVNQLADDVQDMLASLFRRDVFFYLVREEDDANLVVVLDGTERQRGSYLRHHVALHLHLRAEVERAADVYQQHHRQLAFLLEHLHVGPVEARRDVPVDVAHVVAVLILAHLAEGHTPAFEGRMVLPCEDVRAQTARLDLYLPYFLEYL